MYLFGGLRYDAETGLGNDDGGGYLDFQSGRYLLRAGVPLRFDSSSSTYAGNKPWSGESSASVVLDYRGIQARTGSYVAAGLVGNNPWSGGGGGGGSGGVFSEQHRDYLYGKFQDGDIPTQADRMAPRNVLKSYFETGDIPTQEQFNSLIDSAVNLNLQPLGGDLPIHGKVSRAILKTYFLTGKIPTQD